MRKFRLRSESAIVFVELPQRGLHQLVNDAGMQIRGSAGKDFVIFDRSHDAIGRLNDFVIAIVVRMGHRQQHMAEARPTIAFVLGKICPAKEWLAFRSQNDGQWPTALSAHRLHCRLISRIHVEPLIAIDLDRDKVSIDDFGNLGIFVGFAIHHVTPMAPHRADIQQDWLVRTSRPRKCGVAPLLPIHWLMHGRTQVRRRRVRQSDLLRFSAEHSPVIHRLDVSSAEFLLISHRVLPFYAESFLPC